MKEDPNLWLLRCYLKTLFHFKYTDINRSLHCLFQKNKIYSRHKINNNLLLLNSYYYFVLWLINKNYGQNWKLTGASTTSTTVSCADTSIHGMWTDRHMHVHGGYNSMRPAWAFELLQIANINLYLYMAERVCVGFIHTTIKSCWSFFTSLTLPILKVRSVTWNVK